MKRPQSLLTPAQRKKLAQARYKAMCIARGDYKKGGRYHHQYDSLVDSPRRRRYYLNSLHSRQSLGESRA